MNNFQDLTYMYPTFASFKNFKPSSQTPSIQPTPRTFQQLKNYNNQNSKITHLPNKTFRNIINEKETQIKKATTAISFEGLSASRNLKNATTKIKNNEKIKENGKGCQSRPSIIAPSVLKNKSFIQTRCKEECEKKLLTGRSLYSISNNQSIELSDNPNDSVNRSGENSYEETNSFDKNSSLLSNSFKDSLDLDTRQRRSKAKMTFSRKSSRSHLYKHEPKMSLPETQNTEASPLKFTVPKDMYCSMESGSVCDSAYLATEKKNQSSINFSKKIKYFKHQKIQPPRNFTLDDFTLIDEIGEGKYGKVFSAQHKDTGFICALKIVSKELIREENIEEPFVREIKIQMYLNHPNIVKLYGFFHDSENIYLIMESCLDGQLFKLMKEKKSFQQNEILQILSDIYEAVSFMHCHGIIHRDLKPQNIVIQERTFKICDFGWAVYAKGQARSTFCGTPLYVSPQVLKGEEYDSKADVWGLGVLTYELAYGRVPFPIWNKTDMVKIVKDPVYFPSWTNVSEKMQWMIKWMLQKEPEKRGSMNEILSGGLLSEYLSRRKGIGSEVQLLF